MILRQMRVFLFVGTLTVLVDFVTYRGLFWTGLFGTDAAKAIGFLTGTVFAYFANRRWTFGNEAPVSTNAWRFAIVYMITLGVNVFVNSIIYAMFAEVSGAVQIAFLIATGTSAALNFLGMKLYVFRALPNSGAR